MDAGLFSLICFGVSGACLVLLIYISKWEKAVKKANNDPHKYDIKVLENGETRYFRSWNFVDNSGKTDEEAKALIYKGDDRFYHLCPSCFEKQSYKDTFDCWGMISLSDAKNRGLTMCPKCAYEMLSNEEKRELILKDADYIIVKLTASGNEKSQNALSYHSIADYVDIEYDFEKEKYFVTDNCLEKIGALPQSVLKKIEDKGFYYDNIKIQTLTCCIYNIEINDNDKYVCEIAIIVGDKPKDPGVLQDKGANNTDNKTVDSNVITKRALFKENTDKCTKLNDIIRIDYDGEAVPKNASVVTLRNKHKFAAKDYLEVFGYQTHKTAKKEYFFFLDKSRKKKDETGETVYPAIKITAETISHIPDLSTDEAKKYISMSVKERNSRDYVVSAEEVDDLTHYYMGQHLYEEEQKISKIDYCVVDVETTGLNRVDDQIIEISALRVRNNIIVDTFTQLIKPTILIPASATAINGITNEMVAHAPSLKEVIRAFVEFVGDDIVIGHNIRDFDYEFIYRACKSELGKSFNNDYIDTLLLARNTFYEVSNYKLPTLCKELGIIKSEHRAEADCISTKELYDIIKARKSHLS